MICAIYPGTFDPITYGHQDVIRRALQLFDQVVLAVAEGRHKKTLFSLEERVQLARQVLNTAVEVITFSGLMVDVAAAKQARVIIRGLRAVSDFEYEFQMAGINRRLSPEIETVFLAPGPEYLYLSSSRVRELATYAADISGYVAPQVSDALQRKLHGDGDGKSR